MYMLRRLGHQYIPEAEQIVCRYITMSGQLICGRISRLRGKRV